VGDPAREPRRSRRSAWPVDRQSARAVHAVLDMDFSESPTYGEREGSAYNGHFGCTCYHPLFVFNQLGDVERCALRSGNVHSADGWRGCWSRWSPVTEVAVSRQIEYPVFIARLRAPPAPTRRAAPGTECYRTTGGGRLDKETSKFRRRWMRSSCCFCCPERSSCLYSLPRRPAEGDNHAYGPWNPGNVG
jgi:hypothetical protein